jgi:glycerol-3-phosphate dehydrogenase (NAD(P)+)
MEKVAIIGAGGWGTALAILFSRKFAVALCEKFPEYADFLDKTRENRDFLPGFKIPESVKITSDAASALKSSSYVMLAVPSRYFRATLKEIADCARGKKAIIATKGLEEGTGKRMSEVLAEECQSAFCAALSGPTIAREIASGKPAAAVVASSDISFAREIQGFFSSENLRLYASDDIVGVEMAGAGKNVVAIGAGVVDGLDLGNNAKAAYLTRGIVENVNFGIRIGAKEKTYWGLAGLGDLLTTSFSKFSRNRSYGEALARGEGEKFLAGTKMVVEGIYAVKVIKEMADALNVDMPITNAVYRIVYEQSNPRDEIRRLMVRSLKDE